MTIIWMNEHIEKPKLKDKFGPALGLSTSPVEFKYYEHISAAFAQ